MEDFYSLCHDDRHKELQMPLAHVLDGLLHCSFPTLFFSNQLSASSTPPGNPTGVGSSGLKKEHTEGVARAPTSVENLGAQGTERGLGRSKMKTSSLRKTRLREGKEETPEARRNKHTKSRSAPS